jgi:adenine-specific DNA-methyltransferase
MTTEANPHKLNLASHDVLAERLEALKELFPEVVVEGKVDLERLKQHLGDFSHVGSERYGLNWAGKAEAIRTLQQASYATLTPMRNDSVNFDTSENLIIEGDNLEVLKLLQKSYHGKVKMIYIDPPYNTGGDFVYPDNFKEGLDTYLKYSGQADDEGFSYSTNKESGGRYHSNWLNMMYPRLFMAKSLLADDGVIFASIDDHEVANLRMLMNEIFGEENFASEIVWQNRLSKQNDTDISNNHEYIIAFARNRRSDNRRLHNGNQEKWHNLSGFVFYPNETNIDKFSNPDNDPRGLWKADPFDAPNVRPNLTYIIKNPTTGEEYLPPDGRCWRTEEESYRKLLLDNRIVFGKTGNSRPQLKVFYEEKKDLGEVPSTWFDGTTFGTSTQGTKELMALFDKKKMFETVKPTRLLNSFLKLSTKKDSLILDFFAGSGTTADAVMQLNKEDGGNRKYILVQLPEPTDEKSEAHKAGFPTIAHITRERVRRVIAKLKDESNGKLIDPTQGQDLGFKAFKLTASNFKLWNPETAPTDAAELAKQIELYVDNIQPGKTDEAILYEIILKAGFPLTAKIDPQIIGHQTVYVVENGALLVCLADPIEEATLRGMLALKPVKMVALDVAFHGNDQLKTNIRLQSEQTGEGDQSRTQFVTV